jgi:uncharacterized protein
MSEPELAFPYPIPEYGTEPYWEAANQERLVMQKCDACQKLRFTPAPLCTFCASDAYTWAELSGKGKIITWTVITHPIHPAAVAKVPYVVVVVELAEQEGLRMVSNLIDAEAGEIAVDATVEVAFEQHPSGQKLPVFRLG